MARPRAVTDISDARLVKALSHPLRVQMLAMMEEGEWSPKMIADHTGIPLANIAYHMGELKKFKLVKQVREVPRRGAVEHFFRTVPAAVAKSAFDELPTAAKNRLVASALTEVVTLASASAGAGGFDSPQAHLSHVRLRVDEKGWKAVSAAAEAFAKAIEGVEPAEDGTPLVVGWMVFEQREAKPEPQRRRGPDARPRQRKPPARRGARPRASSRPA